VDCRILVKFDILIYYEFPETVQWLKSTGFKVQHGEANGPNIW